MNNLLTSHDVDPIETKEWLDAFASLLKYEGIDRAKFILAQLLFVANRKKVMRTLITPYCNTIMPEDEPTYPGNIPLEKQLETIHRWNAIALVVRALKTSPGVGGHLSTYASIATLYEVGFNHFFKASTKEAPGDLIYFQGHSCEGIYARAFLEGRLSLTQMENFRREVDVAGLSSYPHPWLMPTFWQFATVSLGLGPLQAIYQARFLKYLENRGLIVKNERKVWVFCGDGEMDEPESIAALTLASREKLDNLIYVVNCNLQRLDGLVRGNSKIVQELEALFHGANWNVIKVIWGSEWDALFAKDTKGLLLQRLSESVDGELQTIYVQGGAAIREFLAKDNEEIKQLLSEFSDSDLAALARGGHDVTKVYAAYKAAVNHKGEPTVILAKTVKGYGLGIKGAEGRNIAHNHLEMKYEELKLFCERFDIPLTDAQINEVSFYQLDAKSELFTYLHDKRKNLNGYLPERKVLPHPLPIPSLDIFHTILQGTGDRTMSTTMVLGRIFTALLKEEKIGAHITPIFCDEMRTFGLEGLFRQAGIYSSLGQLYIPEDKEQLLYYREAENGQVLQEGITEAGSMASWIAAATSYATSYVPMIPFFTFYSMFGFQRVGDLIWAAADMRARGFLIGATAGRTSLEGEGLQHQDGHSLVHATSVPSCRAYNPAFGYEMAVIIQHGLTEMYSEEQDVFYYIMTMNEKYIQPAMPSSVAEGIIKGMYLYQEGTPAKLTVQLFGSGSILLEALAASEMLKQDFAIAADVWSVTSFGELRRDGLAVERTNRLTPDNIKQCYLQKCLAKRKGPIIAATDYIKAYADLIHPFVSRTYISLGTDGYGRSDSRSKLRKFFEIDRFHIAYAAMYALYKDNSISLADLKNAMKKYNIDPNKPDPITV